MVQGTQPGRKSDTQTARSSIIFFLTVLTGCVLSLYHGQAFSMGLTWGGSTTTSSPQVTATYVSSFPTDAAEPARMAADQAGYLYVSLPARGKVLILAQDGSLVSSFQGLKEPLSVAVDRSRSRVYIGDSRQGNVTAVDLTGKELFQLGSGKGEFRMPGDIAVVPDGSVYVTDSPNDIVKVYAPDGSFKFSFGGTGSNPGQMIFPTGVASDNLNQEIYVVDHLNARVEVFDLAGGFKRAFSSYGSNAGQLTRPQGLAVANGKVFVTDAFQSNVEVFDTTGGFISSIGQFGSDPGGLKVPKDVALSGTKLFITNAGNKRIEVFNISNPQGLALTPPALSFTKGIAAPPASQTISVAPQVAGTSVAWTATAAPAPFGIILYQSSGTTPSTVTVAVDAGTLSAGTYTGAVIFHAGGVDYPVAMSLTVLQQLIVSPESLSMFYQVDGDLAAGSLGVTSTGSGLSWTTASAAPWLTLLPLSGSTPSSISVSLNQGAKGLPEGIMKTAVTVTAPEAAGGPLSVPVTLTVAVAGTISVTSNLDAAAFTLAGPSPFNGTGRAWSTDLAKPGNYTLQFGRVKGFRKPPTRSFDLRSGQKVVIEGRYLPLPVATVIAAAKGPGPDNEAIVKVMDLGGNILHQFKALDSMYGARLAMGDVDGDGSDEIVVAPGPGPRNEAFIKIYRPDGTLLASTPPTSGTHYGANVAAGDIYGDGKSEIAMSMAGDEKGSESVVIYALENGQTLAEKARIALAGRSGGGETGRYPANLAFGDVNGDGKLELIVLRGRTIEVYVFGDAFSASLAATGLAQADGSNDYKSQTTVSSADVDGDGVDEVIIGSREEPNSFIRVLKGDLTSFGISFAAFEDGRSAPTISAMDWDGDGLPEMLAGQGASPGNNAVARIYAPTGELITEITVFDASLYGAVVSFGAVKN